MIRLGIVGCGLTGSVAAMLLKQQLPQVNITFLEKSRGTGGRMSTSRSELGSTVDLGAQFITRTPNLSSTQEKCYNLLLDAGLLKPLQHNIEGLKSTPAATTHYVCPKGSGSLVKHFLQKADCQILFGKRICKITPECDTWAVLCDDGSNHKFDALVLTFPVPQILQLEGITSFLKSDHIEKLKAVDYCSRYAVAYFYTENSDFFQKTSWAAKFISDGIIRYCSLDTLKRDDPGLPTFSIHTTKEFGKANIDGDIAVVQNKVTERVQKLFPDLPTPTHIKFHKWRYSQVEKGFGELSGSLVVSENPILIFGGDGFTTSNFEGCILSAEKIVNNLVNLVK